MNIVMVIAALVLLAGLLFFEAREMTVGKLLTKTPLSILFVVASLLQRPADQWYFHFIFIGLLCGLAGDVCLALPSKKTFMAGLIVFLLGHVFYVAAFGYLTRPILVNWGGYASLPVLLVSLVVFLYLRPHLGDMMLPTLAYVLVITIMVGGAIAVFRMPGFSLWSRILILAGAILFYLSDLFVARDRFVKNESLNRYIGLPMYYGGQFMIACSVGLTAFPNPV